nr:hypothetical protein [Tanacetum cinerariifolium]
MLLDFDDIQDISDDKVQDDVKGKTKVDEEYLSKPFKEILKCPFTRRIVEFSSPSHIMPANVKKYDGTGDPEDHVGRFVGIGNQREWPMPHTQTTDEMLKRVDDYLRSEEAFRSTELPRGSSNEETHWYSGYNKMIEASGFLMGTTVVVIPAPSPYNIILRRPRLKQLRAVPSTIHGTMKFPTPWGVATVVSQTLMVLKCINERKKQAAEPSKNNQHEAKPKEMFIGVTKGKFFGYMVTSEGIRANPAKTKDIAEMQSPRTWGEMQTLTGKLAVLNRFLSWTAEKSKRFRIAQEDGLRPTGLNTPLPKETLFVYLAASQEAYAPLEKMALALRHVSRRLRRYFEAHPITVITDQPIKQVLSKADTLGRLAQYSVELAAYNITYEPRSAVKGQILADFINETEQLVLKVLVRDWFSSALPKRNTRTRYDSTSKAPTTKPSKKLSWQSMDVLSMDVEEINAVVKEDGETWMTPIINCLERGIWPEDQNEARALRMKISQYVMEDGVLFKRSYLMPMLRKIGSSKGHPTRILLANNAPRHKRRNTQVHYALMSYPLPNPQVAHNTNDLNHGPLAILPMGDGYARTIVRSSRKDKEMRLNLDLLTERREAAAIREARYKGKVEQYYNKRVRPVSFKLGEHVYRKNEASWVENLEKLGSKWEGPYLIVEAYQNGSYKLCTMDNREAAPYVKGNAIFQLYNMKR